MTKVLIGDIAGPTGPTGPAGPAGGVSWVNAVTAFSADPTGGSDSTSEIQAALLSFGTATGWSQGAGGVVYLPAGSYKTSNTLILPPGVVLRGDGIMSTIITMSSTVAADVIQSEIYNSAAQATILTATVPGAGLTQSELVNAFFAGIEDIAIHGNAFHITTASYNHGINFTTNPLNSAAGSDPGFDPTLHINNVFIEACTGDGVFMSGRSGSKLDNVDSLYNNGNGFTTTYDTLLANCNAGFNGVTGVYNNHGTTCGSSIKGYNNGTAQVWVSGHAYSAGNPVYYNGALYFCILAIGSSTTIPSTDTTHFTHLTAATSPQSWGYDFAWDSNASTQAWAGVESQEPSVGSFWFNDCNAISLHGASSVPNFNNVSGSGQNGSNPNNASAVYINGATGCNIAVSANFLGSLAYILSMPSGSASNNILLSTDGTEEGSFAPSTVLTSNFVLVNGTIQSAIPSAMTTLGDTLYGGASGVPTRLAPNTADTKKFLSQTGTGSVGAAPAWGVLVSGDIPNNASNTTGTAENLTGGATLPAYLAPKVTALTDGSSIATNAALGNDFKVTIAGNRTMAAPSNPIDGQKIIYEIKQDTTGSRTITWTTGTGGFSFGAASSPTLTTTASDVDFVAFRYSSAAGAGTGRWCYMGAGLGY